MMSLCNGPSRLPALSVTNWRSDGWTQFGGWIVTQTFPMGERNQDQGSESVLVKPAVGRGNFDIMGNEKVDAGSGSNHPWAPLDNASIFVAFL